MRTPRRPAAGGDAASCETIAWTALDVGAVGTGEYSWADKAGIPHRNGYAPEMNLKQCRTLAPVEYEECEWRKRARRGAAGRRGLTGKAWEIVEPLLEEIAELK